MTRFDRAVLVVIGGLAALIALTVALGDRVGVTLVRVEPLGTARSTSPIVIQFSESMNRESVAQRLRVEPEITGTLNWSGTSAVFRPSRPLEPGKGYTVVLEKGARSEEGREVLSEYRYSFTVAPPRIAYLYPADASPQNIWLVNADGTDARQITFSPSGIFDFGVSPDGSQIAFAERNSATNTSDIKLIDLNTGAIRQLTNCVDADCTGPVWRPDGRMIAYNRVDFNSNTAINSSPTRVWVIDLSTSPATTRPLFSDLQIVGYSPQWSQDGRRIAVFNRDEGILVYDLETGSISAVPSMSGSSGALSADGSRLVFAELEITGGEAPQTRSYLKLADLETQEILPLTDTDEPVQDDRAVWRPGANELAVARRYQDERFTRGYQVFLMNLEDGAVRQLTDDSRYANAFFTWDPTGQQLVIQRFPELDEHGQPNASGRPEIWTYEVETGEMTQVASNAFHPRWAP